MANILTKNQISEYLRSFYLTNWGENSSDKWFDSPAANVRLFARGDKLITLKCHILTGEVSESVEPYTAV